MLTEISKNAAYRCTTWWADVKRGSEEEVKVRGSQKKAHGQERELRGAALQSSAFFSDTSTDEAGRRKSQGRKKDGPTNGVGNRRTVMRNKGGVLKSNGSSSLQIPNRWQKGLFTFTFIFPTEFKYEQHQIYPSSLLCEKQYLNFLKNTFCKLNQCKNLLSFSSLKNNTKLLKSVFYLITQSNLILCP